MMINGLDILAEYQEQAAYGKFIDWTALKADPLNFRFIWIKCSEGGEDAAYIEGAARCVRGARSVNFEAVNPYHYYLHLWYGQIMSATYQANAFYRSAQASGFGKCRPMTDLEDPQIKAPCTFTDTEGANRAVAFARNLSKNLKAYHEAIAALFGVKPDIYTGKWWLDYWVPLLIKNGYGVEVAWMNDYRFILADYNGGLDYPDYIPRDHVIAWQKTSSPVPPVQGIPTGRVVPGDALDIDQWLLGEPEFLEWAKGEQPMATRAYLIPPETCARILTLTQEDARSTVAPKDWGVTAVIIRAGASTGPGTWTVAVDLAWDPHQKAAQADAVPNVLWFELDPAWYRWNNVDEGMVTDRSGHPDRQPVLQQILRCWYGDPTATWEQMKSAPAANWRKISGILLSQFNTVYQGQDVGDLWFTLSIADIFDQLRALMDGLQIPTVPLVLQISPELLQKYPRLLAWVTARSKWLYLDYGGKTMWTLSVGHNDFNTLAECWPWTWYNIDPATYSWFVPDGMNGRIIIHETTKDRLYTPAFLVSGGVPENVKDHRPLRLSLSPLLPEDLMKILIPIVTTPTDDGTDVAALKARVVNLESQMGQLQTQLLAARTLLENFINHPENYIALIAKQGNG